MSFILQGILAFIFTNIDDFVILILYFGIKSYQTKEIITGQLIGMILILLATLFGSLIGVIFEREVIGIIGLWPIYLGIMELIELIFGINEENDLISNQNIKNLENSQPFLKFLTHKNVLSMVSITLANGGDNIGVYIPLFSMHSWNEKLFICGVFLILLVFLCGIAKYFTKHKLIASKIEKYGHVISPFILIYLGFHIFYSNQAWKIIDQFAPK